MWEVVNQIGAGLAVAVVIVGGCVYLFSTAKRGRQDIVRQDNEDLRNSNQELRTERAALLSRVKEQEGTIAHLQAIATQTPAVEKLLEMNAKQQLLLTTQHKEVVQALTGLTGEISHLAGEFTKTAKVLRNGIQTK